MDNLDIINEISQEVLAGVLRDQVRTVEEKYPFKPLCRAQWLQLTDIMIDLRHLWPVSTRLKGRGAVFRYYLTGEFEKCLRMTCGDRLETMYIGGGPKKKGDARAIAPRVFIDAVVAEAEKRGLELHLGYHLA